MSRAQLLLVDQAAKLLGLSTDGVLFLIHRGTLPAEKFGRVWVIRKIDVLRARRRTGPGRPKKGAAK